MENQDTLFKELFGKMDVQQSVMLAAMSAMQKVSSKFYNTYHPRLNISIVADFLKALSD